MRFLNSIRNSVAAFFGQIVTIFFGMVIRWIFVHMLGQEYLGVNSVMESMLMLLSMTELGIGTSVAFALYKPIDDGDERRIGSLMAFYRKVYHAMGILTAVIGPMLIPFMGFFTKEAVNVSHLNLIYLLFLSNTVLSYFFAYKRTLLSAYQQNHINSVTEDAVAMLKYILQAVVLLVFKSFIGYIIINVVCAFLTNVIISKICDKKYSFVKKYYKEKLIDEDKKSIKKSVISLMYQKIGAKLVMGTDNLMISYTKLTLMGIYSNYSMVVNIVSRLVYNVLTSVMGSIGNLMVQKDKELKYKVYEEFVFVTFAFYFLISIGLAACLERFIEIWAGSDWVLSPLVTFVVILNFFLTGMRQPNVIIIEVAGLFNQLRLKAVGEVLVNLVVSLLFLIVFDLGIYGVLFGTTVSMVSVCIWWETYAVHKYALEASFVSNSVKYVKYLFTCALGCFVSYYLAKSLPLGGIMGLIVSGFIAVGIYIAVILIFYGRSSEFKRFLGRFVKKEK